MVRKHRLRIRLPVVHAHSHRACPRRRDCNFKLKRLLPSVYKYLAQLRPFLPKIQHRHYQACHRCLLSLFPRSSASLSAKSKQPARPTQKPELHRSGNVQPAQSLPGKASACAGLIPSSPHRSTPTTASYEVVTSLAAATLIVAAHHHHHHHHHHQSPQRCVSSTIFHIYFSPPMYKYNIIMIRYITSRFHETQKSVNEHTINECTRIG
jgi:hypothetical protein